MPGIGPDTSLFIVNLSRVKSSPLGSPLRIRPWGLLGFDFSENHGDGRWERLVRSSCPHAPAGAEWDSLFVSFSSASSTFKQL